MPAIHTFNCVHELFEAQAARTPDAVAVISGDESITYRKLDESANAVALRLRGLGVGPDMIVAICMERSIGMMASLLGILKAGGAYLPLDPSHPRDRILFMLEDSNAGMVLTGLRFRERIFAGCSRVYCLDSRAAWLEPAPPMPSSPHGLRPGKSHLAYVIYTSGSTGKPKGVAMPHEPLVNLLEWHLASLQGTRRTLQFASLGFDVSFQEIFSTWAAGGALILIFGDARRDPAQLWAHIVREKIERLFLPFVALQQLAAAVGNSQAPALREIITAGEQLCITPAIATLFENNPACMLHNHYGPTESHVVTSFSLAGPPHGWPSLPPIGKPIASAAIHILDGEMRPVAIGETGEICISGACLARGYLNRPDLTAEKFLRHDGVRIYKTGDMGRFLPGGDIVFLGRCDDQVKIRGHRVELGEIEAAMLRHPAVSQCVVATAPETGGGKRLVAYLVAQPGATVAVSGKLVEFLRARLPDYMIPSSFAQMDSLPLTATGKINRRALPLPGDAHFRAIQKTEIIEAPKKPVNELEVELVAIWEELLDIRPIGIHENFFDLGGHSLLAARLSGEVERRLGKRISLMTVLHATTVKELAVAIKEGAEDDDSCLEKIRVTGSGTPFFCVPGLLDLARYLGPGQPCYGLNMPELGDEPESWPTVEEIAAGCIQAMRTVQPEGPYCVGGYSFGGVIAFEIARQLETTGETVSLLALIEPDPPGPFRTKGIAFNFSRLIFHGRKIAKFSFKKQMAYLSDHLRKRRSRLPANGKTGGSGTELAAYMLRTETIHERYHASAFGGQVILFLARDTLWRIRPEKDPRLLWGNFTGEELEIHEIPGDHTTVIREPNVRAMAQRLGAHLEKHRQVYTDEPGEAAISR